VDAHKRTEAELLPTRVSEGKDELNLAEFRSALSRTAWIPRRNAHF